MRRTASEGRKVGLFQEGGEKAREGLGGGMGGGIRGYDMLKSENDYLRFVLCVFIYVT